MTFFPPVFRPLLAAVLLIASAAFVSGQASRSSNNNNSRRSTGSGNTSRRSTSGGGGNRSSSTYQNSTQLGEALITSDAETRRIIVVADEETNAQIARIIADLDQPKPQVLINVVFVQVTHNNDIDLGAEGSFHTRIFNNQAEGTGTTRFGIGSLSSGGFYNIANQDLNVTLHALSTVGKTEILSRPSILARSSQQATIMVGQEVPFITNSRISDTGVTTNTVQYEDIGIILRVTPFITAAGLVEMIVTPEISALSNQTVPISDTVNTPVIDKRSADTVVLTPSDQTVVIGGLIADQTNDQDNKVPILGDIPLIGYAFKRKVKTSVKTELLIFLTPHVVNNPADLAKLTENENAKRQLQPTTFKPEEVNKFFGKP